MWTAGIIEAATRVLIHTAQIRNRTVTNGDHVQQLFQQFSEAGQNREKIQALLYDVTVNEFHDKDVLCRLRGMLEREANRVPLKIIPPHPAPHQEMAYQPAPAIFLQTLSQANREKAQIHQGLMQYMDEASLPEAVEAIHYYILTSVDMLGLIHDIALNSESACELTILDYLYRYLQTPHALLAEANHGAWGLIDDAWIIHNTAYRLIESGLFAVELFPFDWGQIASADNIVVRCLPVPLAQQLEALLLQFMNLIALESKDYQPKFSVDAHRYHPYMGQAQAIGAQPQQAWLPQPATRSFLHL